MGVPSFFRWIHKKYPKITTPVIEEEEQVDTDGQVIPVDISGPNPNGIECDNLYLDMNGIVHPCCHPEDGPAPKNETEMMEAIFAYIDRIVAMVRPRKLLYMAIDGVAPRAKMNQQRSRRFRAMQEAELYKKEQEAKAETDTAGLPVQEEERFDSNVITPGTKFMANLADALRYYIHHRLTLLPGWAQIQIILSDASVAGEGEHKIMQYIRLQRTALSHDPNTKHVLYGLDADLIMLGLATHEPHFRILREDVFANDQTCRTCRQPGHFSAQCPGVLAAVQAKKETSAPKKPFIFLHLNILREYLEIDLKPHKPLPFPWNLERAIDDWVFLCFFVGNDFLPHMPSLEIREGAIDRLIRLWRHHLWRFGDYVTNNGDVDCQKIEVLMNDLGRAEDEIFQRRQQHEERMDRQQAERKAREAGDHRQATAQGKAPAVTKSQKALQNQFGSEYFVPKSVHQQAKAAQNQSAAQSLKQSLMAESDEEEEKVNPLDELVQKDLVKDAINAEADEDEEDDASSILSSSSSSSEEADAAPVSAVKKRKEREEEATTEAQVTKKSKGQKEDTKEESKEEREAREEKEDQAAFDHVRLFEKGWKERYYALKFGWSLDDVAHRKELVRHYVRGLVWVLKYYYQGCVSWKWYYPYHYAPFASDFALGQLSDFKVNFELGAPFKPFEQLMAVFPAGSGDHIPTPFNGLMTAEDSPILDFYPLDFKIDLNGKKHAWQGVALLPFIDEERLLKALAPRYPQLSTEEVARNTAGHDVLFSSGRHPSFEVICGLYSAKSKKSKMLQPARYGLSGHISPSSSNTVPGMTYYVPEILESSGVEDIVDAQVIGAMYEGPKPLQSFSTALLPGVRLPPKVLTLQDVDAMRQGKHHHQHGGGGGGAQRHHLPSQHHLSSGRPQQQLTAYPGRGGHYQGRPHNSSHSHATYSTYAAPYNQYQQQPPYYGGGSSYPPPAGPAWQNAQAYPPYPPATYPPRPGAYPYQQPQQHTSYHRSRPPPPRRQYDNAQSNYQTSDQSVLHRHERR